MSKKSKKTKKATSYELNEEELLDEEDEDENERITPREAGLGLIILGSMLLLVALIMPFVLGTSSDFISGLTSQVVAFAIAGAAAIGVGTLLFNFKRLSRKL